MAGLMALAALGVASGIGAVQSTSGATTEARSADQRKADQGERNRAQSLREAAKAAFVHGGDWNWPTRAKKRGPGWTQAQVQRMARKRRNVLKHRARSRRSK